MTGWTTHQGLAVGLPLDNIDTDQLIPARFMSQPRADGYGGFLLHDLRLTDNGQPDPHFILNRFPQTSVLVAGRNFGSGSSREAAVYALIDAGIQVVIAAGFGDIFAANAANNGLLTARVTEDDLASLQSFVANQSMAINVNIDTSCIDMAEQSWRFDLDPSSRVKLMSGTDDIDLTRELAAKINAFSIRRYSTHAWALPNSVNDD